MVVSTRIGLLRRFQGSGGSDFRVPYNFNVCVRQIVTDLPISVGGSDCVGVTGDVGFVQDSRQQLYRGFDIGNSGRLIDGVNVAGWY